MRPIMWAVGKDDRVATPWTVTKGENCDCTATVAEICERSGRVSGAISSPMIIREPGAGADFGAVSE